MLSIVRNVLLSAGFVANPSHANLTFHPHCPVDQDRTWAFEFGVAAITSKSIEEILFGHIDRPKRREGGELFQLTAARRMGELEWRLGHQVFRPQLEVPLTLEIVNENGRSPFFDYNASFTIRWIDFPWNHWIKTDFSMGLGLSYSEKIWSMDIARHPNEHRSKFQFNWPIQLTFASPRHPEHQMMLFISHQSGGHIFDRGGVNSIGLGYRFGF